MFDVVEVPSLPHTRKASMRFCNCSSGPAWATHGLLDLGSEPNAKPCIQNQTPSHKDHPNSFHLGEWDINGFYTLTHSHMEVESHQFVKHAIHFHPLPWELIEIHPSIRPSIHPSNRPSIHPYSSMCSSESKRLNRSIELDESHDSPRSQPRGSARDCGSARARA